MWRTPRKYITTPCRLPSLSLSLGTIFITPEPERVFIRT
jgi:hypothetical protein